MLSTQRALRPRQVKDVPVAAALSLLPNRSYRREKNGIANVSNATTAGRHWIQSMLAMVPIRISTARLATAKTGVPMDTVLLAVLDSCKPMV